MILLCVCWLCIVLFLPEAPPQRCTQVKLVGGVNCDKGKGFLLENCLAQPLLLGNRANPLNQTSDMVGKRPTGDFAQRPENQKPNIEEHALLRLYTKSVFLKELPLRNLLHPRKVDSGVIDVM